ncbi:TetR/AcrR family transcriptional regulator [Streptomyces roseolus]|uniref:TetR/AcrR family transcriptional regulator n=1 Tax=Streptomyces roseolus TaxID=67358 RepID=UPI0033DC6020
MQTRSHRTRQALVRAMAELVADGPPADAGLVNVCERAGVSRGALYHHFASTAMLAAAVYEEAHHRIVVLMDEAFSRETAEALRTFLVALGESLRTDPLVRAGMKLAGDGTFRSPRLRDQMLAMLHERLVLAGRPAAFPGEDLADLAVLLAAGVESQGRSDPTWWEGRSVDRLWPVLQVLFDPAEAAEGRAAGRTGLSVSAPGCSGQPSVR